MKTEEGTGFPPSDKCKTVTGDVVASWFAARYIDKIDEVLSTGQLSHEETRSFRDEQGRSLLHWAASVGHNEFCLHCIESLGMSVDLLAESTLQTPLMLASMEENLLTMQILLAHGADVNCKDDLGEPIKKAAQTQRSGTADNGSSIAISQHIIITGDNCLTIAAQHEKLLASLLLLSRNIDKDTSNITGCTAAHWAAFSVRL